MEKLNKLFSLCKSHAIIFYNDHKSNGETVAEYIDGWGNGDERADIPDEVFVEMVKRDTVIVIQCYPVSTTSFYLVFHYNIELAVDKVLELVGEKK